MSDNGEYANIRQLLGHFIGQRLIDITQHDEEDWQRGEDAYVCLMFENGHTIKFPITEQGFEHSEEEAADER